MERACLQEMAGLQKKAGEWEKTGLKERAGSWVRRLVCSGVFPLTSSILSSGWLDAFSMVPFYMVAPQLVQIISLSYHELSGSQ